MRCRSSRRYVPLFFALSLVAAISGPAKPSPHSPLIWGWGVQDGPSAFQICTIGCREGVEGSGDGQSDWPQAVAVDAHGIVYVAEWINRRVQKFRDFRLDYFVGEPDPSSGR